MCEIDNIFTGADTDYGLAGMEGLQVCFYRVLLMENNLVYAIIFFLRSIRDTLTSLSITCACTKFCISSGFQT